MTSDSRVADSSASTAVPSAGPGEDFVRLFTQSQRALYLFILPLVSCAADADEVLQETNVVIWSKWSSFQPGTSFVAWGRAIARLEVLRFRRRSSGRMHFLADDVIEHLAAHADAQPSDFDVRRDALAECIGKLKDKDRELIRCRYESDTSGEDVAKRLGRPANSVYQSIGRIRRVLLECVRRRLAAAGAPS